jgi:hypothetical protein
MNMLYRFMLGHKIRGLLSSEHEGGEKRMKARVKVREHVREE